MALSIKDAESDRLARELAKVTGESITEAVREALRERLLRERRRSRRDVAARIRRIQERLARLPVVDSSPGDQILGYDEHGLPT